MIHFSSSDQLENFSNQGSQIVLGKFLDALSRVLLDYAVGDGVSYYWERSLSEIWMKYIIDGSVGLP